MTTSHYGFKPLSPTPDLPNPARDNTRPWEKVSDIPCPVCGGHNIQRARRDAPQCRMWLYRCMDPHRAPGPSYYGWYVAIPAS